eukprot:2010435-Pleurochrysis_carterae.AAC.1
MWTRIVTLVTLPMLTVMIIRVLVCIQAMLLGRARTNAVPVQKGWASYGQRLSFLRVVWTKAGICAT